MNINWQQNNEGEKAKGRWVLCFLFFWVLFCGGSFFFTFLSSPKKIFITKNPVITYKLNTIKVFLPQREIFPHFWFFLVFPHNPGKITKEEEEIEFKQCITNVNV